MKANKKQITSLIEKYFEGLTTLEEEQLLRDYFRSENIPEEWKVYQPIFQFFSEERKPKRNRISLVGRGWGRGFLAVAASLLLLFSLKFAFDVHRTSSETSLAYIDGKKYTDIILIRTEALKALESLSEEGYSSQIDALDFFLDNN
jgi:hypothetical protein